MVPANSVNESSWLRIIGLRLHGRSKVSEYAGKKEDDKDQQIQFQSALCIKKI